jgi:hypothetical protein
MSWHGPDQAGPGRPYQTVQPQPQPQPQPRKTRRPVSGYGAGLGPMNDTRTSGTHPLPQDFPGFPLLRPGSAGYAGELAGFRTGFGRRPDVVVPARQARDAAGAVRYAAERGLPLGIRATGHGLPGPVEGGVLVSTRRTDGAAAELPARTGPDAGTMCVVRVNHLGGAPARPAPNAVPWLPHCPNGVGYPQPGGSWCGCSPWATGTRPARWSARLSPCSPR